jgi:hypothetical protein
MSLTLEQGLAPFCAVCGGIFAAATAFYPALRLRRGARSGFLAILAAVILWAPTTIAPAARLPRCLAAILAVTLVLKLFDLHRGAAQGGRPGPRRFLVFLVSIFSLVEREQDLAPRPPFGQDLHRLAVACVLVALASVPLVAAFAADWRPYPFLAEHAAKAILFFAVLVPLTAAASAGWRMAGGRGLEFMDNPFAARTPADFWRRYNRPVHQFLEQDVFLPAGGRRRPVVGAMAVFAVSAAVHEYLFSVAIGRVQGYQTAFFLLQGVAVAATMRLKPRGPGAVGWVAATFAFNVLSAVLFFASVNGVVPFYDNPVPLWDEPRPAPACRRAYASNPGSAANGGRSNRQTESRSSVGRSATLATRSLGASHTALDWKFNSSKHST